MQIDSWYSRNFEARLHGRYVHLEHIDPLLEDYKKRYPISVIGTSEKGKNISLIQLGNGPRKVLAWSQMHGNESTTTKAIFDFLAFVSQGNSFQKEVKTFLDSYSFFIIPVLNPDGAQLYTRENSNGIDLNRDAKDLSQSESRCLRKIFDEIKPDLCLNLHDQRTMYSLPSKRPATLSFLAPSADKERTITKARKEAMGLIVELQSYLENYIPGQIGRYDDTFNTNCVGDSFTEDGVPTILFEAGHYPNDYNREKTREYVFYALTRLLVLKGTDDNFVNYNDYSTIPENEKLFKDVIIRNVKINDNINLTSLAIRYDEILENDEIIFVPFIDKIDGLEQFIGHKELNGHGVSLLLNSHEIIQEGEKVLRLVDKNAINVVIF